MSKPVMPPVEEADYAIDIICDGEEPPKMVQTHLRHLLLACELGDLVLIQCIDNNTNRTAYVLCAHVVSANNKARLLPICELADTADLLARMRPPAVVENGFVKPTHSGNYTVCLVSDPNEVRLAEVESDSVH